MSSTAFKKGRATLKSWVESKELREGTIYESRVSLDDSSTAFGIQGIPPFLPPAKLYVLCPIEIMTWKQQVLVIQVNSSYLLKGEQPDMSAYFCECPFTLHHINFGVFWHPTRQELICTNYARPSYTS